MHRSTHLFRTYAHAPTSHTCTHTSLWPDARPQLWLILPGAMTFSELIDRVGSKGPFQLLHVVLLGLPVFGIANHNLLQIFTASTPEHHCRPPPNASAGPWVLPMGLNGKPETCLRFVYPSNASLPNDTQGATEPCLDGWAYVSTRDSIVTEVRPEATLLPPLPRPAAHMDGTAGWGLVSLEPRDRALGRQRGSSWVQMHTHQGFGLFILRVQVCPQQSAHLGQAQC